MNFIRLFPVYLSFFLMAAHLQRGAMAIPALLCLVTIFLLLVKKPWVARLFQLLLVLFALEWVRTLFVLIQLRIDADLPWTRLALILGIVTLFTATSALLFHNKNMKLRYKI